ncbi:MAG: cell division protein FtsX [Bacteroidaceae bacterium]
MKKRGRNRKSSVWAKLPTVVSMISTTMVLVLLGMVVLFALTARELSRSMRESLVITVVLQDDVTEPDAMALRDQLSCSPYVKQLHYISREQALEEQRQSMDLDPTEFLGENPFAISMELTLLEDYSSGDSLMVISEKLKREKAVADVLYQKDLVDNLNLNLNRASAVLLVVAVLLIIISMSLINNMVRMLIFDRRFSIYTMKLVGARWSFVRRPFMLRAVGMGIGAAFIADLLLIAPVQWLLVYDPSFSVYIPLQNIGIMAGSVLLFGLTLMIVCTYVSVTRVLRFRESDLYQ